MNPLKSVTQEKMNSTASSDFTIQSSSTPTCSSHSNTKQQPVTPTMKTVAGQLWEDVDKKWSEKYPAIKFKDAIRKVPDINLTPRRSKVEKRKNLRKIHRNFKKHIESTWAKEKRDVETLYGTRQSRSAYDKQRTCLFLETKEKAVTRTG